MKFAKVLQQTLIEEDIPQEWIEGAIQYKVLKKCIGRIVDELEFLGLSKSNLKLLLQDQKKTVELHPEDTVATNPMVAQYVLRKHKNEVMPYLKIVLNDTESTSFSNEDVLKLAGFIREKVVTAGTDDEEPAKQEPQIVELKIDSSDNYVLSPTASNKDGDFALDDVVEVNNKEIIIKLNSDMTFFGLLNSELKNLDHIRNTEEQRLVADIDALSEKVVKFSARKSDLYNWREIFRMYLDSEVYFRYNEIKSQVLEKNSDQIKQSLSQYQMRVEKSQIIGYNKKATAVAYESFIALNQRLLKIIQYQSINTEALRKILKKFDKQTCLNVSSKFPKLMSEDHISIRGKSVAQSICFVMQNKLLTLIPQIDDYTCPICMSIAFKPIRLSCGHIFCVRCLVKLKQRGKNDCPFCRYENAITLADSSNLDLNAMVLIKKYFPNEVKEKTKDMDKERYEELMGSKKGCEIS